jgi:uncharacterized SAM-binding protein YcdF (DUF218 family)
VIQKKAALKKKVLAVTAAAAVMAVAFHEPVLKGIGNFLVTEDKLRKADVIMMLRGAPTERILTAVELFDAGWAPLIVIADSKSEPGREEFRKRVGDAFIGKSFTERAVMALGVPEGAFRLLDKEVQGTWDEAWVASTFMRENGHETMLLVTSKWHSKRASLTFRSVSEREGDFNIVAVPSMYDSFSPGRWWRSERDAELVFREYIRFIYYLVTMRISVLDMLQS